MARGQRSVGKGRDIALLWPAPLTSHLSPIALPPPPKVEALLDTASDGTIKYDPQHFEWNFGFNLMHLGVSRQVWHTCTIMHTHMHTHMRTHMRTHAHARMHRCMPRCMHAQMYVYMHACTHGFKWMHLAVSPGR